MARASRTRASTCARHATASTAFQILGQMSGPVVFALLAPRFELGVVVVLLAFTHYGWNRVEP